MDWCFRGSYFAMGVPVLAFESITLGLSIKIIGTIYGVMHYKRTILLYLQISPNNEVV